MGRNQRGDWGNRKPIPDKDPDGFAKVEGRYLERFLEGIPLVLGYTEVAYLKRKTETPIEPSRGLLPAFRITERLRRAMPGGKRVVHRRAAVPHEAELAGGDGLKGGLECRAWAGPEAEGVPTGGAGADHLREVPPAK